MPPAVEGTPIPVPLLRLLTLLGLLLLAGCLMASVEVQTAWGFDGTVVPNAPNQLEVLVTNTGEAPVEGNVTLQCGSGFSHGGEPWVTQVYLAAHGSRRVVFAPWMGNHDQEWHLSGSLLGRGMELEAPRQLKPGRVLLVTADDRGGVRQGLRIFDEERFPATVALCDGLGELVMDHVPRRWSADQAQAARDWVHGGGTLHMLKGMDGAWPAFTGDLAEFAGSDARQALGQGLILRHDRVRGDLPPELASSRASNREPDKEEWRYRRNLSEQLTRGFAILMRPDHPWWLINLVLLVFLASVGLGPWLAGRSRMDWRWINLGVISLIALTAWAVTVIGRRGYGEESLLRSVTLARQVAPNTWDAQQWANLFVVASGRSTISHPGGNRLYTGLGDEPDPASLITMGREAQFLPMVPLFSNRPFAVRLRQEWAAPPVVADGREVRWSAPAPPVDRALAVQGPVGYLLRGGQVHGLRLSWGAPGGAGMRYLADEAGEERGAFMKRWMNTFLDEGDLHAPQDFYRAVLPLVVTEDMHHLLTLERGGRDFAWLLATSLPEALRAVTATPLRQDGAVIYRIPIPGPP